MSSATAIDSASESTKEKVSNNTAASVSAQADTDSSSPSNAPIHVVFIHLDLGIGGAEQLVLSLATASQDLSQQVSIVTSRCDQDHCFSQVKQPDGRLADNVLVCGKWIPTNILGKATALCSTLRMLYLAYKASSLKQVDVICLDVLPTPIPFLMYWYDAPSVLFYCHFPDKLLTRDTVNGVPLHNTTTRRFPLFVGYRAMLDWLEEATMAFADVLVVNSKFTMSQVQKVFTSLANKPMRVLYPVLDTTKFDAVKDSSPNSTNAAPIVSLNRFERKKNIELLLLAYSQLCANLPTDVPPPPLVIAGGYDTKNVENVEYMGELRELAKTLGIAPEFKPSVSDAERTRLLTTALCVVYTPHLEHFGIVPLEAMYAGRPVVAVNSGGPMETVVDGETGYLCDATPQAFCNALRKLVLDPKLATAMGRAGHDRVKKMFGIRAFEQQWKLLLQETIKQGKLRRSQPTPYLLSNSFFYLIEAALVLLFCVLLTHVLRSAGVLAPNGNIWGTVRDALHRHEEL